MKKPKSKTPTFKTIFFQKWGTFSNETMICIAMQRPEIISFMKRAKVKKELIEKFEKIGPKPGAAAFVWTPPGTGCTLLWMGGFANDDEDIFDLVHETNHLVFDIARDKGFRDEAEINAYQQEFLFKNILKELRKRYKKFRGKIQRSKRQHGNENPQGADDRVPHVQSRFDRVTKEISGSEVQVPRNA
jgi:hypothetical protein